MWPSMASTVTTSRPNIGRTASTSATHCARRPRCTPSEAQTSTERMARAGPSSSSSGPSPCGMRSHPWMLQEKRRCRQRYVDFEFRYIFPATEFAWYWLFHSKGTRFSASAILCQCSSLLRQHNNLL